MEKYEALELEVLSFRDMITTSPGDVPTEDVNG